MKKKKKTRLFFRLHSIKLKKFSLSKKKTIFPSQEIGISRTRCLSVDLASGPNHSRTIKRGCPLDPRALPAPDSWLFRTSATRSNRRTWLLLNRRGCPFVPPWKKEKRKGRKKKKKKVNGPMDPSSRGPSPPPSSGPLGPFSRKVRSFTPTRASEKVRDRLVYTNKFTRRDEWLADDEDREIFEGRKMLILCFFF